MGCYKSKLKSFSVDVNPSAVDEEARAQSPSAPGGLQDLSPGGECGGRESGRGEVDSLVGADEGRVSTCSYHSYQSYDDLSPSSHRDQLRRSATHPYKDKRFWKEVKSKVSPIDSLLDDRDVALVSPNGTFHRLPHIPPGNGLVTHEPRRATTSLSTHEYTLRRAVTEVSKDAPGIMNGVDKRIFQLKKESYALPIISGLSGLPSKVHITSNASSSPSKLELKESTVVEPSEASPCVTDLRTPKDLEASPVDEASRQVTDTCGNSVDSNAVKPIRSSGIIDDDPSATLTMTLVQHAVAGKANKKQASKSDQKEHIYVTMSRRLQPSTNREIEADSGPSERLSESNITNNKSNCGDRTSNGTNKTGVIDMNSKNNDNMNNIAVDETLTTRNKNIIENKSNNEPNHKDLIIETKAKKRSAGLTKLYAAASSRKEQQESSNVVNNKNKTDKINKLDQFYVVRKCRQLDRLLQNKGKKSMKLVNIKERINNIANRRSTWYTDMNDINIQQIAAQSCQFDPDNNKCDVNNNVTDKRNNNIDELENAEKCAKCTRMSHETPSHEPVVEDENSQVEANLAVTVVINNRYASEYCGVESLKISKSNPKMKEISISTQAEILSAETDNHKQEKEVIRVRERINIPQLIIEQNYSVYGSLMESFRRNSAQLAVICKSCEEIFGVNVDELGQGHVTFADLHSWTNKLSHNLRKAGLGRGDVVAILSPNTAEYPLVFLSTISCGAVLTLVDLDWSKDEVKSHLNKTGVTMIMASAQSLLAVHDTLEHCAAIKAVYILGNDRDVKSVSLPSYIDVYSFKVLLTDSAEKSNLTSSLPDDIKQRYCHHDYHHNDVVLLARSQDITDEPRIVPLTHRNITESWKQLSISQDGLRLDPYTDRALCLVPFSWTFGLLVTLLYSLLSGITVVTVPSLSTNHMLHAMDVYKITLLYLVPGWVSSVSSHPLIHTHPCRERLAVVVYGGVTRVTSYHIKQLRHLTFRYSKYIYGYTETSCVLSVIDIESYRENLVSQYGDNISYQILDVKNGRRLTAYEKGLVYVKGAHVSARYTAHGVSSSEPQSEGRVELKQEINTAREPTDVNARRISSKSTTACVKHPGCVEGGTCTGCVAHPGSVETVDNCDRGLHQEHLTVADVRSTAHANHGYIDVTSSTSGSFLATGTDTNEIKIVKNLQREQDHHSHGILHQCEGWLNTGEIGYFDEMGCLYVTEHHDECLHFHNYKIHCKDLRELIVQHPAVEDATIAAVTLPGYYSTATAPNSIAIAPSAATIANATTANATGCTTATATLSTTCASVISTNAANSAPATDIAASSTATPDAAVADDVGASVVNDDGRPNDNRHKADAGDQVPKAYVTLRDLYMHNATDQQITGILQHIMNYVNVHVPDQRRLRGGVELVEQISGSENGRPLGQEFIE